MKKSTLYLVDSSIYIFRAYFSMPDTINNQNGDPINAVYGYLLFISKFLEKCRPSHVAFIFDESLDSCFRNTIYPEYKSSRGLPDDSLALQLKMCRKLTEALGFACYSSKKYEADDLLGSIADQYNTEVVKSVFVTRDKDIGQLLSGRDQLWDFAADEFMNSAGFEDKFGVKPLMFPDYLALVGDAVDDIPGVKGLGPKVAVDLLARYKSLDTIYRKLDDIACSDIRGAARVASLLEEYEELAFISRELATIRTDLRRVKALDDLVWQPARMASFQSRLKRFDISGRIHTSLTNAFDKHLL